MDAEKNKIEFWDSYQTIECALFGHKPKKPMSGKFEVVFTYTTLGESQPSKSSKKGMTIPSISCELIFAMIEFGYITEANQIVSLTIDKRESRIPGIAFFMQEVE